MGISRVRAAVLLVLVVSSLGCRPDADDQRGLAPQLPGLEGTAGATPGPAGSGVDRAAFGAGAGVQQTSPAVEARGRVRSASCATARHPGGDWPSLNHDLANSRSQPAERTIGVEEATRLTPAWSFLGSDVGAPGGMRSTPIVSGGCVYLGLGQGYLGNRGDVVALNADTGQVVWHVRLDGSVLGLAAANGMIYATPSRGTRGDVQQPVVNEDFRPGGSYAVALDARTGRRVWTSQRLDDGHAGNGTFVNASPVAFRTGGVPLLFVPLSGGAGDGARVPMYLLDARTGTTIRKAYALTAGEYREGFGGAGIWSTAAYDPATQHLYAGTADSDGHTRQHRYNNAILKIDANPRRRTFATVVDSYSGTSEHADLDTVIGSRGNPLCGSVPDGSPLHPPTFFDTSAAPECLELDLDFGASPNLVTDRAGRLMIGALQKSGVFHMVDAATMSAKWRRFVGPGGPAMDGGTSAVGDGELYVGATPNLLFQVDQDDGAVGWVASTGGDAFAYQPVTHANGVLYVINDAGFLSAFDSRSGTLLLHRPISVDGGFDQCLGAGAGVTVARNTVYTPCDAGGLSDLAGLPAPAGGLVAYRVAS